jgi:acyl-CoA synthetase (AMP-forming)/AMP-acid ligase II
MRRGLPPVAERTLVGERSLRLAAGFAAHGIGPRQPAALLDNSLDAVHAWSGLGLGGMVEVPVNTAYKERFLAHVLNDSGAELIVIEDGYAGRLAAVAGQLLQQLRHGPTTPTTRWTSPSWLRSPVTWPVSVAVSGCGPRRFTG